MANPKTVREVAERMFLFHEHTDESVYHAEVGELIKFGEECRKLGRAEIDADLAAELTGGSSILRDPSAVVDVSQVDPEPWLEEG